MSKKIHVDYLVLEVTRRCDMLCLHCLRGDAQNIDMTQKIVDKVLDDISAISSINFTGGEPTLNTEIIRYFFEQCERRKIEFEYFYIVTNGKKYSSDLVDILIEAHVKSGCPEANTLTISEDQFHEMIPDDVIAKYKTLCFYAGTKKLGRIIDQGNARKNYLAECNNKHALYPISYEEINGKLNVDGLIYVSANGNVLYNCDLSYATQARRKAGNILNSSLYDIVYSSVTIIKQDEDVA